MARFSAETVKLLGRELYDYEFSDESATAVAHIIGAWRTIRAGCMV